MTISFRPILLCAFIGIAAGCSDPTRSTRPVPPPNRTPEAYAGPDIMVVLPATSAELRGSALDADRNIESYRWRKVSGPDSYTIQNPGLLRTAVMDLQLGRYVFELSVTDGGGLTARDTVGVLVYDPGVVGANELVFQNRVWQCPMGCTLGIEDIHQFVPQGRAMRVFIQQGGSTGGWTEAIHEQYWAPGFVYSWGIYNDDLWVYSDSADGTADVRINF